MSRQRASESEQGGISLLAVLAVRHSDKHDEHVLACPVDKINGLHVYFLLPTITNRTPKNGFEGQIGTFHACTSSEPADRGGSEYSSSSDTI
ncbi:hypothetical protein Y032_0074g905 [Ancylostoma ceylanicum]|uniref:Uncharacterized protein n=1 Tax=Ancylostoma ceylanicum TaxID=53326 RepID=A0A016TVL9_9BILA|nr:hypothetical protein Y032_0074g905 [Ancylostoma ceylanicum]